MKFHNGCWLMKEGVASYTPKQIYEYTIKENEVTICAPTKWIQNTGDTLACTNLTLQISAPAPDVLRVQVYHYKGKKQQGPEFQLRQTQQVALEVTDSENSLVITNGKLQLTVTKNPFEMTYTYDGKFLSKANGNDVNYIRTSWTGEAYEKPDQAYICQQLGLSVGELIYGLGERFTPFVKNGQSIEIWNRDGGTSTEQAYKNIPFYMSNKGYGIFVNHPEMVEFEVGTEQVSKVAFSVKGETLDYYIFAGKDMKDVLVKYTDLTGKPGLPPQWTFGLWLSTSFTTDYDEETVMSFINGMEERGIPLSVFHFDCCWMKDFHWSDFIWNEEVFPDPKGMLERIKAKGIKICVWINSYIGQESALFQEGMEKGYFIQRANGDVWQWDLWQPGMAIVDFTNPAAKKWYQDKLEILLDMGVDCFKTDFGERIPTDVVYYDHSDPQKMHNYYTYLYNQAVFELLERKKGKEDAVVFARSATTGCQQFPVHWGGDCYSTYEAMGESLRGGLSLTSSGFGYWSHDIGGFEQTSTADVYKRWAAFGLLSSHSRLHGSSSYRVPWLYDEEAVEVVRFFTKLKLELLPYLYSSACQTAQTGIPMMRSMALSFENDKNCAYLDKQYMLGEQLLVAPIFNEEGIASYYLPKGTWVNYLTGEYKEGGSWQEEKMDYFSIPLFVKENSIIPVQKEPENALDPYHDKLQLKVYHVTEKAECTVYENGKKIVQVQIEKIQNEWKVNADCEVPFEILFMDEGNNKQIFLESGKQEWIRKN